MENLLSVLVAWARDISAIAACAALLIGPIREKLFGIADLKEGVRCLLRAEIVRIYYRHNDDKTLKEYEFKNLSACYSAYKALKGNSFIDHIYKDMQSWTID